MISATVTGTVKVDASVSVKVAGTLAGAKVQIGQGWGGYRLSAGADLNGDGMADIVSVDSKGTLFFYAAKGGGLFAKKIQIATGW
ncbi:MAG: VCBS repeat-containing protein [Micrococcales bacterium]|nr:VCBS repeat-containing protein [Micrococcales bacterium]